MFINLTNHPSSTWQEKQIAEAQKYGQIVDIAFPKVDPYADEAHITALVSKYYSLIIEKNLRPFLL